MQNIVFVLDFLLPYFTEKVLFWESVGNLSVVICWPTVSGWELFFITTKNGTKIREGSRNFPSNWQGTFSVLVFNRPSIVI